MSQWNFTSEKSDDANRTKRLWISLCETMFWNMVLDIEKGGNVRGMTLFFKLDDTRGFLF